MPWNFHQTSSLISGMALIAILGCGGGSTAKVPVHRTYGTITWNGQPLEGASVQFHSVEPIRVPGIETPLMPGAQSKPNGLFEVTTFKAGDGLPKGEYLVTVSCENRSKKAANGDYPELLPAHYQDPAKSGLKVTIKSGSNKLDAFELKQ